jgi:hypothetical protein
MADARSPGFQGGTEWACPCCAHVVYWPLHHKVVVKGQAEVLHIRAMEEVPVHLDDIVVELAEADEWMTLNAIAWSGVVAR